MGRFSHEALAGDPWTGIVYETEDAGSNSGFYRFLRRSRRSLHDGGSLQMLGIQGQPKFDTRTNQSGDWLRAVIRHRESGSGSRWRGRFGVPAGL
jgi:secreted PhoX family phosphatase